MRWFRRKKGDGAERRPKIQLGLDEAIEGLRADLATAMNRSVGQAVQVPLEKMTVELAVLATKSVDGTAHFKVPIMDLELGGDARRIRENTQKVTLEFASERFCTPEPIEEPG